MKKKIIYAVATLFAFVACQKAEPVSKCIDSVEDGGAATISVSISGHGTKALVADETNEARISRLEVLVFNKVTGAIDGYAAGTEATLNCNCTKGEREIYAVVNSDAGMDLSSVIRKSDFLNKVSKLSSNSLSSGFVMIGNVTKTVSDVTNVDLSVDRIASRVWVKKVTKAFTSDALQALDFNIVRFYLTNVVAQDNMGNTFVPDATASYWINKMKYESSNGTDALTLRSKNELVVSSVDFPVSNAVYAYPNPTVSDVNGGTFTARHTRWIMEATVGGTLYYYPVTLPVLDSNKSYEINNLTVTRLGSTDPDEPVQAFEVPFSITVNDWDQVLINGDGEVEI